MVWQNLNFTFQIIPNKDEKEGFLMSNMNGPNEKEPKWTDSRGKEVPYGKTIIGADQAYYVGGTVPKRANKKILFPESMDEAERGFGVDEDIYNG